MAASRKVIAAGNRYAFMGYFNDIGYLTGGTNTPPAAGANGSGLTQLLGVKEAPITVPENDTVPITGDDSLLGEFLFPNVATRRFTVTTAVMDMDIEAELLGITVEQVGEIDVGALDIEDAPEFDSCFIFQSRAKKQDAGVNKGKKAWSGHFVPLANAQPLNRQTFSERAGAVYRYDVVPQVASHNIWGTTIAGSGIGTDALRLRPFSSEYPVHIMRFTGDGITATFNLDFTPITAAKTKVLVRRVAATVLSVSTVNDTFTLSAIPPSGAEIIVVYEFTE